MRIDLHLHSTSSDGSLTPPALVHAARAGGLDIVALTDHDTVAGIESAMDAAREHSVHLIPAIEMSTTVEGTELHILGYFVDPTDPPLVAHAAHAADVRERRIRGMVALLEEQGIRVPMSAVLDAAGPHRSALGRPHLAKALVDGGHVTSVPEAFDRWIGDGHPAFLPTELLSPAEGIAMIRNAGGLPVWAHPPMDRVDGLLPEMVRAGLRGIEVYRPRLSYERIGRLERIARTAGLLISGGSDWHGPDRGPLGEFSVTEEEVGELLEAGGL